MKSSRWPPSVRETLPAARLLYERPGRASAVPKKHVHVTLHVIWESDSPSSHHLETILSIFCLIKWRHFCAFGVFLAVHENVEAAIAEARQAFEQLQSKKISKRCWLAMAASGPWPDPAKEETEKTLPDSRSWTSFWNDHLTASCAWNRLAFCCDVCSRPLLVGRFSQNAGWLKQKLFSSTWAAQFEERVYSDVLCQASQVGEQQLLSKWPCGMGSYG